MPVTKVYDSAGRLVHDCAELGCEASWDGVDLATGKPVDGQQPLDDSVKVNRAGTVATLTDQPV